MKGPSRTPSTYIALLRGINLGGHKIVKMDQLRKTFEELGFADVKTYIQSGNAVFKAPAQIPAKLAKRIEEKVLLQFGFPVAVVVKTAAEIGEVISNNPLLQEKGIDPTKLHVTFLACAPDKSALKTLDAAEVAPDQFRWRGHPRICFAGHAVQSLPGSSQRSPSHPYLGTPNIWSLRRHP
jgi:uncharacterized protein (DUF1697 family)